MLEVQKRGCPPLEHFIFSTRLKMWPIWQKGMADHVDGVRKLAEGSGTGIWRKSAVSEAAVKSVSHILPTAMCDAHIHGQVCQRYVVMFNSFVALTSQQEETMIFNKYV